MKKKTRRTLLLALLFFFLFGVAAVFARPKIKRWLSPGTSGSGSVKKVVWSTPADVLGALISNEIFPDVITHNPGNIGNSSPGTNPTVTSLAEGALDELSEQVQKAVKDAAGNIADSVKQAVISNVSINQDKIAQDITAKLLQSLLNSAGKTSQPVDRGVYDACTNIVKNTPSTATPIP